LSFFVLASVADFDIGLCGVGFVAAMRPSAAARRRAISVLSISSLGLLLMSKPQKEKTVQPWDRRPWPDQGDANKGTTYYHVGQFLSFWEKYEAALAYLFSAFLGGLPISEPARRAFFSVRTFEGRAEMLRAASAAYFDRRPNEDLQGRFKEILSQSISLSPRRNEITHGFVDSFATEDDWKRWGHSDNYNTFALYPSIASFRERDLGGIPSYCMTSKEISYFYDYMVRLQPSVVSLAEAIIKDGRATSAGKPRTHGPS
jgi:hypothetical protein